MRGFSEICMLKKCNAVMKVEKSNYETPVALVTHIKAEGIICVSKYMQFGSDNSSGNIDDDDVIDGGSF